MLGIPNARQASQSQSADQPRLMAGLDHLAPAGFPRMPRHFRDYLAPFAVLLLLYAGYFKANPLLSWVPVDLTLLGALLTLVGVAAVLIRKRVPRGAGAVLALWATFMPMAILHANNTYGSSKSLRLFTLTLLAALGPLFLMRSGRRQQIWVVMQIVLGAVLAIGTAVSPVPTGLQGYIYQQAAEGSTTIGSGRAAGVAMVGCFVLALAGHRRRALLTAIGAALVIPLILSGSRGPVLAAMVAMIIVAALAPGSGTKRLARIVLIAIGGALTYLYVSGSTTGGAGRIALTLLKDNSQDASAQIRLTLWHYTVSYIMGHPWGTGWGGLQYISGFNLLSGEGLTYPHNVLLEMTGEAGWIAGAAVILFLWFGIRRLRAAAASPVPAALLGIAVFFTINAMVSGDVNDNRTMWASVAIGWVVVAGKKCNASARSAEPRITQDMNWPFSQGNDKWMP